MFRHLSPPREGWQETVEAQGLVFPLTVLPDGSSMPYWNESAFYELSLEEVTHLEEATEELHRMSVEAGRFLATGAMGDLGLTPGSLEIARESLEADPPSLYGRFDLAFDGSGPAKMLEYNADTPTGVVEAAVVQWYWLQDLMPDTDQWNSLHERLVDRWRELAVRLPSRTVHFAHDPEDSSGEELMTVGYLRDTAQQAGLETVGLRTLDIGYHRGSQTFRGRYDETLDVCFKLYPWEEMLAEPFGAHIKSGEHATTWLEPVWKVLLSNKMLLAALWHLYPDHPNLLPTHTGSPGSLTEWVAKPLHGREGANIRVRSDLLEQEQAGPYGAEGFVYQAWHPLPSFDGNHAVIGSWVVGGKAAGAGIRESDSLVTDYYARFVPHVVSEPAPSAETAREWRSE